MIAAAHGACADCGCAHEECECTEAPVAETYVYEGGFECHGTYLSEYRGFRVVRKLGLYEAFVLLRDSKHVKGPQNWPGDRVFLSHAGLVNRGWAAVDIDRERGRIRVVYNHDGRYTLQEAGLHGFLEATRQATTWSASLRALHDYVEDGVDQ